MRPAVRTEVCRRHGSRPRTGRSGAPGQGGPFVPPHGFESGTVLGPADGLDWYAARTASTWPPMSRVVGEAQGELDGRHDVPVSERSRRNRPGRVVTSTMKVIPPPGQT